MYELTIKVCASELADLEPLLCEIAEKVSYGVSASAAGDRASSYGFSLEEHMEETKQSDDQLEKLTVKVDELASLCCRTARFVAKRE